MSLTEWFDVCNRVLYKGQTCHGKKPFGSCPFPNSLMFVIVSYPSAKRSMVKNHLVHVLNRMVSYRKIKISNLTSRIHQRAFQNNRYRLKYFYSKLLLLELISGSVIKDSMCISKFFKGMFFIGWSRAKLWELTSGLLCYDFVQEKWSGRKAKNELISII